MRQRSILLTVMAFLLAMSCRAQSGQAPVLTSRPRIPYPPIARAAHVQGAVVIDFAIDSDGRVVTPRVVSGPEMLRGVVLDVVKSWRFQVPLPVGAQDEFEARYIFGVKPQDDTEDDLDGPPWNPCCGDVIMTRAADVTVTGEVRSRDGSQTIDVTPDTPHAPADSCAEDKQKHAPEGADSEDYVELLNASCIGGCAVYRVRVSRNGVIAWRGYSDVADKGERDSKISGQDADTLLAKFATDAFWSACGVPPPDEPRIPDPAAKEQEGEYNSNEQYLGKFLTVRVAGVTKSVNASQDAFADIGAKLMWAVDRTADTHRWRLGDPASEPYSNMAEDLGHPKPGVTALIRATYHFNPSTAEQTSDRIKLLLKQGVSVDEADSSGWTPLMYAASLSLHPEDELKLLLEAHAEPNRHSAAGDTALMMAAYRGDLSETLLAHGADINAHNAAGATALMLLAQGMNTDELQDALKAGANPRAEDNAGHTALDYLRAASCDKPLIALPPPYMTVVIQGPAPCPDTRNPRYVESEKLLTAAMKSAASGVAGGR